MNTIRKFFLIFNHLNLSPSDSCIALCLWGEREQVYFLQCISENCYHFSPQSSLLQAKYTTSSNYFSWDCQSPCHLIVILWTCSNVSMSILYTAMSRGEHSIPIGVWSRQSRMGQLLLMVFLAHTSLWVSSELIRFMGNAKLLKMIFKILP